MNGLQNKSNTLAWGNFPDFSGYDSYDNPNPSYTFGGTNYSGMNPYSGQWGSTTGGSWLDSIGGMKGIQQGLSGLGSLISGGAQLYSGIQGASIANKALGLAKQQFAFQKGLANRNLANQAKMINTQYDNAATAAAGLAGYRYDPEAYERVKESTKEKYVDASPIK